MFSPVYGAGVAVVKALYRLGWRRSRRLEAPVISVGSLSAGGAGKTPVVLMLAAALRRLGYEVKILTRGYRRASTGAARVGPFDDAAWHGDEPVMMAQRAGVPVYVGRDRYEAGVMAGQEETGEGTAVYLLDDGFQHRRLARDFDVVLLTKEDVGDRLLPGGNLREPLSSLAEADAVVVRKEEAEDLRDIIKANGGAAVWVVQRRLELGEGTLPTMPFAFCGIARPDGFMKMLRGSGYEPVESMFFPDHHGYRESDVTQLLERAQQCGANGFVTTEKDAVKLTPLLRDRLETVGPIVTARLEVELLDENDALAQMIAQVDLLDRRKR